MRREGGGEGIRKSSTLCLQTVQCILFPAILAAWRGGGGDRITRDWLRRGQLYSLTATTVKLGVNLPHPLMHYFDLQMGVGHQPAFYEICAGKCSLAHPVCMLDMTVQSHLRWCDT